jgi:hypothetical protein
VDSTDAEAIINAGPACVLACWALQRGHGHGALLATWLFGDPAAGFCENASASFREHPALLRLLDRASGRVLDHLDLATDGH